MFHTKILHSETIYHTTLFAHWSVKPRGHPGQSNRFCSGPRFDRLGSATYGPTPSASGPTTDLRQRIWSRCTVPAKMEIRAFRSPGPQRAKVELSGQPGFDNDVITHHEDVASRWRGPMRKASKVIITCAPTGSIRTPSMSPHLPTRTRSRPAGRGDHQRLDTARARSDVAPSAASFSVSERSLGKSPTPRSSWPSPPGSASEEE